MNGYLAILWCEWRREKIQHRSPLIGLIQPLLYLFVLGSGVGGSSILGKEEYLRFTFPGIVTMSLLFTATLAAVQVIIDRELGFFKAVLVAPLQRSTIALGLITASAVKAFAQGIVLLLVTPVLGINLDINTAVQFVLWMIIASIVFSSLGVAIAASFSSIKIFPIITHTILMPMYFVSGAMFPLNSAPPWIKNLAYIDPAAYVVDILRGTLYGKNFFPVWLTYAALGGFILIFTITAIRVFERGEDADAAATLRSKIKNYFRR